MTMKERVKDVGRKVLTDCGGAEAKAYACGYPSRVREGRYPLDCFRDSQIEVALTCGNDDVREVMLSAKTIYHALRRLRVFTARARKQSRLTWQFSRKE
jgi:hypothetical protein